MCLPPPPATETPEREAPEREAHAKTRKAPETPPHKENLL